MKVHEFEASGDAYDETQYNDELQDGDVLVVRPEGVIGVVETWPVAVTKNHGSLHSLRQDSTPEQWAENVAKSKSKLFGRDEESVRLAILAGWKKACEIAREAGFELSHN